MVGEAYPQFADQENREFFKKWRAWASENLDYLSVKRDLFDSPCNLALDSSAHIIDDRGYLFLFRGGFDAGLNKKSALRASIPINRWLQLNEAPGQLYQIKEIYPNEGKVLATVSYGDEFLYDMPSDPAVILSLQPVAKGSHLSPCTVSKSDAQIIPAFTQYNASALADKRLWSFDSLSESVLSNFKSQKFTLSSKQDLCEGVVGKALRFNAGSKGIELGDFNLVEPASLSFWLKTNTEQSDGRILSQLAGPGHQQGAIRWVNGDLQIWNSKGWPVVVSGLSSQGVWQHVVLAFEKDGTVTGYLNGKKSQQVSSRFDFKGVEAGLGSSFLRAWGEPFIGAIDELTLSPKALSAKEVAELYQADLIK